MAIVTSRHYRQVLSTSLAERSRDIEDLVSNSNILYAALRREGKVTPFEGPEIRQTLRIGKQDAQWYRGYDLLANPPVERWNDARWSPKAVVVPVSITGQEIRANQGSSQIVNVVSETLDAAESDLVDAFEIALFDDGTGNGGKSVIGLKGAVPINASTGVYGGINRANVPIWRTSTYDANSDFSSIGSQVDSTTVRPMLTRIMSQRSRGARSADLLIMSEQHYMAYDAATTAIQRITRNNSLASMGFSSIEYVGGGKRAEIVLASGLNTSMPDDTTFGIETRSLALRYRSGYNFATLFEGEGQQPINQDALAQFIGWEGELTLTNPLFTWRFYDSSP